MWSVTTATYATWFLGSVAVLLHRITYTAGCTAQDSPTRCTSWKKYAPQGQNIISIQFDCDDTDVLLSIAWNWRVSPTCLITKVELDYTCNSRLLDSDSDGQSQNNNHVIVRDTNNEGTGSLNVERRWSPNATYTTECQVGGAYLIEPDGSCYLQIPPKRLNATCSILIPVLSTSPNGIIQPSTTATSVAVDVTQTTVTTVQPRALSTQQLLTVIPVESSISANELKGTDGTRGVTEIVAALACIVVLTMTLTSITVIIIWSLKIRRKYHKTLVEDFTDDFKLDFFPVKPDKVIFSDNVSLESRLFPLEVKEVNAVSRELRTKAQQHQE